MEVSNIMKYLASMVALRRRGGDAAWFYDNCRRDFDLK